MMPVNRSALVAVEPSAVAGKSQEITNGSRAILKVDVIAFHGSRVMIRSLPLSVLTRPLRVLNTTERGSDTTERGSDTTAGVLTLLKFGLF
jgi:hypothetical protein